MNLCAPILFVVFNRPLHTREVLKAIRRAKPSKLYIASDGPRDHISGELEKCAEVCKEIQLIDWDCECKYLLRSQNLGCGKAVSEAISWFFQNEEMGIILEDDCLPCEEFFDFASIMLQFYKSDERIGQISGFNLMPSPASLGSDYLFTHFGWNWGWATWARAWKNFDINMDSWQEFKQNGLHKQYPFHDDRVWYFDQTFARSYDTWDYQWHYALASNFQLSVVPAKNLVVNIGFGESATHTFSADTFRSRQISNDIPNYSSSLCHPSFVMPDAEYEERLVKAASGTMKQRLKLALLKSFTRFKTKFTRLFAVLSRYCHPF